MLASFLAPWAVCRCGHHQAAHSRHTHLAATPAPSHCSRPCDCPAYDPVAGLLIVDDVLTTGDSMERRRAGRDALGVVAFARGPCPPWVLPLLTLATRLLTPDRGQVPQEKARG